MRTNLDVLAQLLDRPCGSVHSCGGIARVARRAADKIARVGGKACSLVINHEGLTFLELQEESSDMEVIGTYEGVMPRRTEVLIYDDLRHHLFPEEKRP